MPRRIDITDVAEAGLSECARNDGPDCMPGFGAFLVGGAVVAIAVIVWLSLAAAVTGSIVTATSLPRRHRALWLLAVWGLPLFGAALWCLRSRKRIPRRSEQRKSFI
ncbi:hypothetical protein SAMN05444583_107215 [Rhodococcus maanshanensis]|uniref:Phospholipase_D-nuclease N-terminal n=1 Tax=Rhodococcus maanshanensis TaxID=183556 RepID=A0A1H7P0R8_9NOCA|nr:hypothetical protein SAMN05444583_107215 [Rhodococcus maanshanensis]